MGAKESLLAPIHVSRETLRRLETYETLLLKWQKVINLVGPSTLNSVWVRHFRDSLQLLQLLPAARRWVDIGSGGGFPGLVIAAALADDPDASITLVESDSRKCAFLREVAREIGASIRIENKRAENIVSSLSQVDAVTARALAPLDKLVEIVRPLLDAGATALFPKGRGYEVELTHLSLPSTLNIQAAPSLTDPEAAVIIIRGPSPRTPLPSA